MEFTLLLIEADVFFRPLLEKHFTAEGVRLLYAERLADAVGIAKRKKIDVALIDLSGLRAEGLAIARQIKQSDPKMEMITITGADQINWSMDAMKLGAFDDFIVPVDIKALTDRIRAAAERRQMAADRKRSFLKRCQDAMAAAAFAEEGEVETARAFLENRISKKKTKKGEYDGTGQNQDTARR